MIDTLKMLFPWAKADDMETKENMAQNHDSITAPKFDDGAIEIETNDLTPKQNVLMQHFFGSNINPEIKNSAELIDTYRNLVNIPEVDNAVDEIVDDAIVYEDNQDVVSVDLDGTNFSSAIKERILEEFNETLKILNFETKGSDHFRRWYVDSRIYFHKVINYKNPKNGVVELRRLNPKNMQFVREVITEDENGIKVVKGYKEFFIYDTGSQGLYGTQMSFAPNTKVKLPKSSIVYAHSGLVDECGKNIIGYLHRAIKPANQLKMLEDAMVIYRLTRAPEKRIFYIDTGNMPNRKASQYMNSIMNGTKNRVVYDAATGQVKNQQRNMAMTEDYWLQRRDGKAVTDVQTLPSASGMNEIEDIKWMNSKLYQALRIPLSRMPNENGQQMVGFATEITRDELKFSKFIRKLQHKFSPIILDPLETNLVLKKIITKEEWEENKNNIKLVFNRDSYFSEIKDVEILERRINILQLAEPFIGKYYSHRTAMKDILKMTDEEIEQESKLIEEESKDPRFTPQGEEEF